MGWKPTNTAIVYQKEYHWTRSPEVWGSMFKIFLAGAVIGLILGIYLTVSNSEEIQKSVDKATVPTICLTPSSAPKGR